MMPDIREDVCPHCEAIRKLEFITDKEDIVVKGEAILTHVEYLKCTVCGSTFDDMNSRYDCLEWAYKEYERRHRFDDESESER